MTTRSDLQFAQDWNLDAPGSAKAEYYAPIMQAPWTPEDIAALHRNIKYWSDQFKKDREAREAARPDLYKRHSREWWK